MKKQQTNQKRNTPKLGATKGLNDQDLNQVVGGLNPQPLPPALRRPWSGPGPDPHADMPTAVE
ncbi:MAG TPA: hypothetical protein VKT82_06270 [Ktedonobacterales bacterium]|nr:hypothetical protein [Ktedonobacterales bacterium]